MCIGMPFVLFSDSFTLPEWLSLIFRIVATLGTIMLIAGLTYDWLIHLQKRS